MKELLKNKKVIIGGIVGGIAVVGGWLLLSQSAQKQKTGEETSMSTTAVVQDISGLESRLDEEPNNDTDVAGILAEIETVSDEAKRSSLLEKANALKEQVSSQQAVQVAQETTRATNTEHKEVSQPKQDTNTNTQAPQQTQPKINTPQTTPQKQEKPRQEVKTNTNTATPKQDNAKKETPKTNPANEPLKIGWGVQEVWKPRNKWEKWFYTEKEAIAYFESLPSDGTLDRYDVGYGSYPSNKGVIWLVYVK